MTMERRLSTKAFRRSLIGRPNAGLSVVAIDRDAANAPCCGRFRRRDAQYAVAEGCRDLVLIDVVQRYASFESAVIPLAEPTTLVFRVGFFLAGNRKHAIRDFEFDVLLVESRQFGR